MKTQPNRNGKNGKKGKLALPPHPRRASVAPSPRVTRIQWRGEGGWASLLVDASSMHTYFLKIIIKEYIYNTKIYK
jgi:hypothetical protein